MSTKLFALYVNGVLQTTDGGGGTGAVDSVFGRTGDVLANYGDYNASLIDYNNSTSGQTWTNVQEALDGLEELTDKEFKYPAYQDMVAQSGVTEYTLNVDENCNIPVTITDGNKIINDISLMSITDTEGNLIYQEGSVLKIKSNVVKVTSYDPATQIIALNNPPKLDFRISYDIIYKEQEVPEGKDFTSMNYVNTIVQEATNEANEIQYNNSDSNLTSVDVKSALDEIQNSNLGITFDTSYSQTGLEEDGTIYWNDKMYTLAIKTDLGITIESTQETLLLIYNDTGADIDPLRVLHLKGIGSTGGNLYPTMELADASDWEKIQGTLGVTPQRILNGELGFVTLYGRIENVDTSNFSTAGKQLWVSDDGIGSLTEVKPEFPSYSISIGGNFNTSPSGEILVNITKDIYDTFVDAWDGSIRETFSFEVESDGVNIVGYLSNSDFPNSNLTAIFSDGFYTFDSTPKASVSLTPGTTSIPQENYIYINKNTKALESSTSGFPSTEHAKIAIVLVLDALKTKEEGALKNQNWNDHVKSTGGTGHLLHISEALREKIGATWLSGVQGTATVEGTDVFLSNTAGQIKQLHTQNFPIINTKPYAIDAINQIDKIFTISDEGDLSSEYTIGRGLKIYDSTGNDGLYTIVSTNYTAPNFNIEVLETIPSAVVDGVIGDKFFVVNDFNSPYRLEPSLSNITTDASGNSLNNTSFSVVLWGVANKSGEPSQLVVNFPTNTYSKNFPEQAVSDAFNYSVYTIPSQLSSVGFLIARITLVNNGGNYTVYETEDLRGKIPNTTAGGGGGGTGVVEFTGLIDTPSSYLGQANKVLAVNEAENGLEFVNKTEIYDTGWISESAWQGLNLNINHALNTDLIDLDVKLFISSDGTNANTLTTGTTDVGTYSGNYGYTVRQIDANNISIDIGANGLLYIDSLNVTQALTTNAYYYRVKIKK